MEVQPYLVDLMPAVLVLTTHGCVLMEEELTTVGVAPDNGRVIQRCEAVAVLVIWGGAKLQKGLWKRAKEHLLMGGNKEACRLRGPVARLTQTWASDAFPTPEVRQAVTFPGLKQMGHRHAGQLASRRCGDVPQMQSWHLDRAAHGLEPSVPVGTCVSKVAFGKSKGNV